jgi:hypothetical protein
MSGRCALRNHAVRLAVAAFTAATIFTCNANLCSAQSADVEARRFELHIENGRLAGDVKEVQVKRDEAVEIVWSTDRPTVLHLHGYDIEVGVNPGEKKLMAFRARATGRFPIEAHGGRHVVLLYIEVHPR